MEKMATSALVVSALFVLAACGSSDSGQNPSGQASDSPSETAAEPSTATTPPADAPYREVEFVGRDGETRAGRLFGDGDVGVVLSYMGRSTDSQEDWAAFAEELADRGYLALTYQRHQARYQVWQDVVGGVDYLREEGLEKVVVAGASLGAMASLHTAQLPDVDVDGVIWFAGVLQNSGFNFEEADVSQIGCPMLLISGDEDTYGAAEDARMLHEWASVPSELLIVPSNLHGTDILAEGGDNASEVTQAMLSYIDDVAAGETSAC